MLALITAALAAACQGAAGPIGTAPDGATVVSARNIAFEQQSVTASADQPTQIWFENFDSGIEHNVHVVDGAGNTIVQGPVITGGSEPVDVPALPAGSYTIFCDVHPAMRLSLVVD